MSNDVPNDPSSADDNPFQPHRKHGTNPDEWLNSAAVYVRMSTEHQQYSTSNQMDVIREYAKKRGKEIVKEYSDDGKSGLNIKGRGSLEQMIRDVLDGNAHYKSILVYDVSRWGRFQDADESAYYEYICKQAGVAVHYCAEQFENDGSPISTIIKGIKRTMAGEYSRELSTKVYQGACRLVKLGFRQGGAAGYGLRRVLVDANGVKKGELKMGEQKSIQTDRVVLVAGPDEEVAIVRRIYHEFVTDVKFESEIAAGLNAQGIVTDYGRAWNRGTVHQVLTSEKYIGNNVYSRTSCKLKKKHVNNPPSEWVRANGVFAGIITPELFLKAQEIILARSRKYTDAEMLEHLRAVLLKHGRISGILIDAAEDLPSSTAFNIGDTQAVKTKMRFFDFDKELLPSARRLKWKLHRVRPFFGLHFLQKRHQNCWHRDGKCPVFAAFGIGERNFTFPKIHAGKRNPGFAQPAASMQPDFK